MLAVEKEEAQGEADQQVIAVLEAAATTAAQLEATERSLAQVRGRGRVGVGVGAGVGVGLARGD